MICERQRRTPHHRRLILQARRDRPDRASPTLPSRPSTGPQSQGTPALATQSRPHLLGRPPVARHHRRRGPRADVCEHPAECGARQPGLRVAQRSLGAASTQRSWSSERDRAEGLATPPHEREVSTYVSRTPALSKVMGAMAESARPARGARSLPAPGASRAG